MADSRVLTTYWPFLTSFLLTELWFCLGQQQNRPLGCFLTLLSLSAPFPIPHTYFFSASFTACSGLSESSWAHDGIRGSPQGPDSVILRKVVCFLIKRDRHERRKSWLAAPLHFFLAPNAGIDGLGCSSHPEAMRQHI